MSNKALMENRDFDNMCDTMYKMFRKTRFHKTFAMDVACRQRTLILDSAHLAFALFYC